MPLTENQKQSRYKYAKNNLKRIPLDVSKSDYEEIKAHAADRGESVNGFIKRAISETIERDIMEKRFAEIDAQEPEKLTPEEAASLAEAEAMDDGTTMTLEEYKAPHIKRNEGDYGGDSLTDD